MLVTNFKLKYALYKIICGFYQAADIGRIHPMRERSLRALQRSVDYIENTMPDALGFESQRELTEFALGAVRIEGHYLEFGVFTGGTIRFIAKRIGALSTVSIVSKACPKRGRALVSVAAPSTSAVGCRGSAPMCGSIVAGLRTRYPNG